MDEPIGTSSAKRSAVGRSSNTLDADGGKVATVDPDRYRPPECEAGQNRARIVHDEDEGEPDGETDMGDEPNNPSSLSQWYSLGRGRCRCFNRRTSDTNRTETGDDAMNAVRGSEGVTASPAMTASRTVSRSRKCIIPATVRETRQIKKRGDAGRRRR